MHAIGKNIYQTGNKFVLFIFFFWYRSKEPSEPKYNCEAGQIFSL